MFEHNAVVMIANFSLYSTEIRTHGVAYYQFATDEEKRQEQLAALNKLRDQVLSITYCKLLLTFCADY